MCWTRHKKEKKYKNTELGRKIQNGISAIKWQNKKLKQIKRMDNNWHIPDMEDYNWFYCELNLSLVWQLHKIYLYWQRCPWTSVTSIYLFFFNKNPIMWFQYMRKTIIAVFCGIKDYKHSRTPPLSLFGPRPITDHILVAEHLSLQYICFFF